MGSYRLILIRFALFIVVWLPLASEAVEAHGSCQALLSSAETRERLAKLGIDKDAGAWRALQFPIGAKRVRELSDVYVKNVTESLVSWSEYFDSDKHDYESFVSALQEQHRAAVIGDGSAPYTGYFLGNTGGSYLVDRAGEFRQGYTPDVQLDKFFLSGISIFQKSQAQRYLVEHVREGSIAIDGIPPQAQATMDRTVRGFYYRSTEPEFVPLYLQKMHGLMEQIRRCEKCSVQEIGNLAAHYFRLGVIAHPFLRVNSSLFMVQINYFLLKRGFSGLTHSTESPLSARLDAYALALPEKEFVSVFLAELERRQARRK
jgi:hypothetical protein